MQKLKNNFILFHTWCAIRVGKTKIWLLCGFAPCIIGQLGQRVEVAAGGGAAVGEGWVGEHVETFVLLLVDFRSFWWIVY